MNTLFVTWDGPEQDYLRSLFFPQLAAAARFGVRAHVLQFGWSREHSLATAQAAPLFGVSYRFVRAPRRPLLLSTAGSILFGAAAIRHAAKALAIDIVIPRSIIPAAMVLAASAGDALPMVFDADGLAADERVDFSGWSATGPMYRIWRDIEAQAVRRARAVIARTQRAREILLDRAGPGIPPQRIHVVPNGKDPREFTPRDREARLRVRAELGIPADALWCIVLGSYGPQYLPERTVALFAAVLRRRPTARLHVLTGQEELYRRSIQRAGLDSGCVWVGRVAPSRVAEVLASADVGFALRAPTFSQRAVCPIKVGEFLLCGLPVVATKGVGDLDEQLASPAAHLLGGLDDRALDLAATWVVEAAREADVLRSLARELGMTHFSLDSCAEAFARAIAAANTEHLEPCQPALGA